MHSCSTCGARKHNARSLSSTFDQLPVTHSARKTRNSQPSSIRLQWTILVAGTKLIRKSSKASFAIKCKSENSCDEDHHFVQTRARFRCCATRKHWRDARHHVAVGASAAAFNLRLWNQQRARRFLVF